MSYPKQALPSAPPMPHDGIAAAGQPIAMQPMPGGSPAPGGGWMGAHQQIQSNCPPGLEYLCQVDQLMVKQKVEGFEAITGFEMNNKYEIVNTMGQRIFYAVEDTCCCSRNCCGHHRPFDIKILNNQSKEVMHLSRGLRCSTCWCPCCLQKVTVEAPAGNIIGYVAQAWSICKPRYKIQNANEETVLRVKGPCCTWNMCGDIEFDVTTADEMSFVGCITKQWSGLVKEAFTDADNFGVSFPMDLDVNIKAVMMGAVFLIDFMYFENNQKKVKSKIPH
ncbi:hypothetical protein CHS0354_039618 [Potamilus streckersoni]|uniref:Phospholipid scramblase n=1 Tax=Potamilus streckersoni TaxID=2493646 RepID=A0AAE0SUZ1_9BIVA|nr:hypothetical protein CHS0354_039618 [Potamilus streckersoni]